MGNYTRRNSVVSCHHHYFPLKRPKLVVGHAFGLLCCSSKNQIIKTKLSLLLSLLDVYKTISETETVCNNTLIECK